MNMTDLQQQQQVPVTNNFQYEQQGNPVNIEEEDTNKWEIETEVIIDKICRSFLGEIPDADGNWIRDYNKQRRMNEKGMSVLKTNMLRVTRILFLSKLQEDRIFMICRDIGKNICNVLTYNYKSFEIDIRNDYLSDVVDTVVDTIFFALMSAQDGGMRDHRERSKHPVPFNVSQQLGGGVM